MVRRFIALSGWIFLLLKCTRVCSQNQEMRNGVVMDCGLSSVGFKLHYSDALTFVLFWNLCGFMEFCFDLHNSDALKFVVWFFVLMVLVIIFQLRVIWVGSGTSIACIVSHCLYEVHTSQITKHNVM